MRMDLGPLKSRWRNIATAPRSETLAWLAVFFATFSTIVLGRFACNCVLTKVGNPCVLPEKKNVSTHVQKLIQMRRTATWQTAGHSKLHSRTLMDSILLDLLADVKLSTPHKAQAALESLDIKSIEDCQSKITPKLLKDNGIPKGKWDKLL